MIFPGAWSSRNVAKLDGYTDGSSQINIGIAGSNGGRKTAIIFGLLTCAGGSLVPWDLPKKWDVVYSNQGGDWNDFARNWTLAKACFQVLAKELGLKVRLGRLKLLTAISRAPPIPSTKRPSKHAHPCMLQEAKGPLASYAVQHKRDASH